MARSPSIGYRSDIDGLRALAVVAVIIYHFLPNSLPGGFVGVDIFFVISGYLISSIILKSLEESTFSLIDFYARRIRRIFPALLAVLLFCIVYGWVMLPPDDYRKLGKHIVAAGLFVSNFVLHNETGYFDINATYKPLLHLWSLAVEEQFYLAWPIVLAIGFRLNRIGLFAGAGFLASFACNMYLIGGDASAAFFFPHSRFWELFAGITLASWKGRRRQSDRRPTALSVKPTRSMELLPLIGVSLIGFSFYFLDSSLPFPGAWALIPVTGSLLVIGANQSAWINRRLFSSRVSVFIGKISYPLYLWHWPVLAFHKIWLDGQPESPAILLLMLVAVVVCAWLTYVFIETPLRAHARMPWRLLGGAMLLCILLGLLIHESRGVPARYPEGIREIAGYQFDYRSYRKGVCFLDIDQSPEDFSGICSANAAAGKRVLLWGDSHAASLYPGLDALYGKSGKAALAQFTAGGCPPIVGFSTENRKNCLPTNRFVISQIKNNPPDTVILSASWHLYQDRLQFSDVERTIRLVVDAGVRQVVVIGQLPVWETAQLKTIMKVWHKTGEVPQKARQTLAPAALAAEAWIEQAKHLPGVLFLSPLQAFCEKDLCLLTATHEGRTTPIAWDVHGHLTVNGSRALIDRLSIQ